MPSLEDNLTHYFNLKKRIKILDAKLQNVRKDIRDSIPSGTIRMQVYMQDERVELLLTSRTNRRCNWDVFKAKAPGLYTEVVKESKTTYLNIRKGRKQK